MYLCEYALLQLTFFYDKSPVFVKLHLAEIVLCFESFG